MEVEKFFGSGYTSLKRFTLHDVPAVNDSTSGVGEEEFMEMGFDLNEQLIRNRPATSFLKVNGSSMINAGIFDGDIVIVDRSIKPKSGKIIIAVIDGEMLIRRIEITMNKVRLIPETGKLAIIDVSEFNDFTVWGVVTCVIRVI